MHILLGVASILQQAVSNKTPELALSYQISKHLIMEKMFDIKKPAASW